MAKIKDDIRAALKALGCKGRAKIIPAPFGFYVVYLNGVEYGVWDVDKRTFTA